MLSAKRNKTSDIYYENKGTPIKKRKYERRGKKGKKQKKIR